jgi:hypothetical protein
MTLRVSSAKAWVCTIEGGYENGVPIGEQQHCDFI